MKFMSLCSGCGGMDLGLEKAGMKCIGQVEIMNYALRVLNRHWKETPKHTDIQTLLLLDSPVKTYLERTRKGRVLRAKEAVYSLNVCELSDSLRQLGYSLKMFPDYFRSTEGGTWELSCKRFPKAGMGMHGEFWTVNISDSPNDAKESSLSDILEDSVHLKYYLSKKAVAGMVRRSEKCGRGGYVFLQEKENGKTRRLKRISLTQLRQSLTETKDGHCEMNGIQLLPKQSEAHQEETLPLYGKTLILRKLTVTEKEKLQGFPINFTLPEE